MADELVAKSCLLSRWGFSFRLGWEAPFAGAFWGLKPDGKICCWASELAWLSRVDGLAAPPCSSKVAALLLLKPLCAVE